MKPLRPLLGVLVLVAVGCTTAPSAAPPEPPRTEPAAGQWRTWVLPSPADVAVAPPPEAGSEDASVEARELRDLVPRRDSDEVIDRITRWAAAAEPVSGPWIRMAMDLVATRPDDPPASSRAYALVAVAAYDATVTAWHYKYRYGRAAPQVVAYVGPVGADPSYPSEHAAVAGAASAVLAHLFPEAVEKLEAAAREAAESRLYAGANWRSDIRAGLLMGAQVAERVIAYAQGDGSSNPCDRPPPGGRPEHWAPPTGITAGPVQPCAGDWKTWVLAAGNQLRPPAPPALATPEFGEQAREVIDVQRRLNPARRRAAAYWAAGAGTPQPAGLWNEVTIAYLRERRPTEPHAERVMALANVAMADAAVAAWDAKYAYWDPRPGNAVVDLGIAPAWKPLLDTTPLSPAYVSGHAAYAGAIAEVLTWLFPENQAAFRAKAAEAADAPVWGGTDWGLARSVGLDMGKGIGRMVIDRAHGDGAPGLPPVRD